MDIKYKLKVFKNIFELIILYILLLQRHSYMYVEKLSAINKINKLGSCL